MTPTRRAKPAASLQPANNSGVARRLRLRVEAITREDRWRDAGSVAVCAAGCVLALDLLWMLVRGNGGSPEFALVDEPAHFATAVVLLASIVAATRRVPAVEFLLGAAIASVAIDLDHLPGELGWGVLSAGTPRPHTHGLLTVALLLGLGWWLRGRPAGRLAFGAAFGVGAHLFRDLATGPGLAPIWPLSDAALKAPYWCYAAALVLIAAATAVRSHLEAPGRWGQVGRPPAF